MWVVLVLIEEIQLCVQCSVGKKYMQISSLSEGRKLSVAPPVGSYPVSQCLTHIRDLKHDQGYQPNLSPPKKVESPFCRRWFWVSEKGTGWPDEIQQHILYMWRHRLFFFRGRQILICNGPGKEGWTDWITTSEVPGSHQSSHHY